MKLSLALLSLAWSPLGECKLRGTSKNKLRKLVGHEESEEVQSIADKVKQQVQTAVDEGIESEIDLSGVAGVTESVLTQIKNAVGEENMTEDKVQEQADKIADLIAAKYIDTEATDEGASAETSFDLSGLSDQVTSINIEITIDLEKTQAPTEAPTESPTEAPTESPTEAPTPAPTEAPTESPTEAPTESPTEAPTESPTEAPTPAPTDSPTESPTDAPTEAPTESPTETPTEAPTEAPTEFPTSMPSFTPPVLASIFQKAVGTLSDYVEENEISLPTLDTERISSIAEQVFGQIEEEAGDEDITEEYLENNAEKIAQLIATDYLEIEITEGGEPLDLSQEDMADLMETVTEITIKLAIEAGEN